MDEYPREVRAPPLLLTALVGASAELSAKLTESLHETAIAACGQKRVKYLTLNYDIRLPPTKRGGKEVQGYRVAGLLKRRWLEKVCTVVPAVIVLCFDWSSSVHVSQQDEAQATVRLQHARRQAKDREVRILLFVVLHASVSDPDSQCSVLRQQPEGQSLVIATGIADVTAKAQKLERLVYQNAMAFYGDEEKRHRKAMTAKITTLPQWAQNALQVRASFKVAFLSEFRRDARGALRSYIRAYEQLIKDTEVADIVERMDLCNHISIRMYQLYLQSHDVAAAVHHCRIHTATLRSGSADAGLLAWRRWHWLASNHQLFAELLESVAQQLPLLIDQADIWQFPGYHYQSASAYVSRLRRWATEASTGNTRLPPASGTGGDIVPSVYVGQAASLDRPEESPDAAREVQLRAAHAQANSGKHGERCLQLLTRAQAACKERGYASGSSVCSARVAEEYLASGNLVAASKLYERLGKGAAQAEPRAPATWSTWPILRRFTLERSIVCGCQQLGLESELRLLGSTHRSSAPAAGMAQEPGSQEEGEEEAMARIRQRLLQDAFEYVCLPPTRDEMAPPQSDIGTEVETPAEKRRDAHLEVLNAVKDAFNSGAGGAASPTVLELPESAATAEVAFAGSEGEEAKAAAGDSGSGLFCITLTSLLAVPLEVGSVSVKSKALGDVALRPASGTLPAVWPAAASGGLLKLVGEWPQNAEAEASCFTSLAIGWAAVPGVQLVVRSLRAHGKQQPLIPELRAPLGAQRAAAQLVEGVSRASVAVSSRLRAAVFTPVDPNSALVSEAFIIHLVVFAKRSRNGGSTSPPAVASQPAARLSISCTTRASYEQQQDPGGSGLGAAGAAEPPTASLIATDNAKPGSAAEWELLPLSGGGGDGSKVGRAVAELLEGGALRRVEDSPAVVLAEDRLEGLSLERDPEEEPLAIPIIVRCGRAGRVSLAIRVLVESRSSDTGGTLHVPDVAVRFLPALDATFEDRVTPGATGSSAPRKFTLKPLTTASVQLTRVEFMRPHDPSNPGVPAIGPLGQLAAGAVHAFVLPPQAAPESESSSTLSVRFMREGALAAFFPWLRSHETLLAGQLPAGVAAWPVPADLWKATAPSGLSVELDHHATGDVAKPVEVQVRVRRSGQSAQEVKVQVIRVEAGESADKYLLGGPASSQSLLVAGEKDEAQQCSTFTLVPLRPGWLSLPRVQVSAGGQEAMSSPSTVFVFPSAQPCQLRVVA